MDSSSDDDGEDLFDGDGDNDDNYFITGDNINGGMELLKEDENADLRRTIENTLGNIDDTINQASREVKLIETILLLIKHYKKKQYNS